jgi:YHS domain-containing protein
MWRRPLACAFAGRMFSFLIRLIVFLIAISAIKSVVNYGRRLWYGIHPSRPLTRSARPGPPPSTVLQMDPVCGTYVAVDSSFKKIAAGKVYHFCSAECRNRFTV